MSSQRTTTRPRSMRRGCGEAGLISARVRELTERIDATFEVITGHEYAHRWSEEALAIDPGWIEIRAMAREALNVLNQ